MLIVWLKFIICAAIIFFAGSKLTKYGDAIAEKTGLSHVWIGIVLLAAVTSLPELATNISATVFAKAPDLAVGDILGACMINMFSLAVLDLLMWVRGKQSLFIKPRSSNIFSAFVGAGLLSFIAVALAVSRYLFDFVIFGFSIYTLIIFVVYLLAQKVLYSKSKDAVEVIVDEDYLHISKFNTYFYFSVAAVIVIIAGSWLPFIGSEIVSVMGWSQTFVAILFLGLATTLPEMTVSFSALRLGQVGMGVGNLIGSNIFNLMVLFVADVFYQPASLFQSVSPNMIYTAVIGAVLMGIAFVSLKRQIRNHVPSFLIILIYILSLFFLYTTGQLS